MDVFNVIYLFLLFLLLGAVFTVLFPFIHTFVLYIRTLNGYDDDDDSYER